METTELVTGSTYNLDLHPERLYGSSLTDVKFMGRVEAALVSVYGIVPAEEHRKVYSTLPDGVPDDATQYSWLIFETVNGNLEIIGEPWVVANSVSGGDVEDVWDVEGIKGNTVTPQLIRQALSAIGIFGYTIKKREA